MTTAELEIDRMVRRIQDCAILLYPSHLDYTVALGHSVYSDSAPGTGFAAGYATVVHTATLIQHGSSTQPTIAKLLVREGPSRRDAVEKLLSVVEQAMGRAYGDTTADDPQTKASTPPLSFERAATAAATSLMALKTAPEHELQRVSGHTKEINECAGHITTEFVLYGERKRMKEVQMLARTIQRISGEIDALLFSEMQELKLEP